MRILVTGHNGYVGSHVVSALRKADAAITVVCRDEGDAGRARFEGLDGQVVSLGELDALRDLAGRCDGVAHLAASEDPDFLSANRAAITAMVDGLRTGSPFVMQGGSIVFGDTGPTPVENPGFNPPPPLAAKATLDQDVLAMTCTARTFISYGSLIFGGRGAMIPNTLLNTARRVGYSAYIDDGAVSWSAAHIEDWADLIVRILTVNDRPGGAVFPAAQALTMRDVATAVANAYDPPLPTRSVSAADAAGLWGFFAAALAMNQNFDRKPARRDYGWSPQPRDFAAEMSLTASLLSLR